MCPIKCGSIGLSLRAWITASIIGHAATFAQTGDDPKVLFLQAARDGDSVVVAVQVERPADMSAMTIELPRWRTRHVYWPRVAWLRSAPVWRYPAYLEYERDTAFSAVTSRERLTFLIRGPAADSIEMMLGYPTEDGGWKDLPVRLDISAVGQMPDHPAPGRRWARAQAEWFETLADYTRDVGGFWTYAAQQSRRQFALSAGEDAATTMRSAPGPRPRGRLYEITTGALAIQESLQLDRMTQTDRQRGQRTVPISEISGIAIKSHPFDRMRDGREPRHSDLARFVPADHYYVWFRSVPKLLEVLDFAEQWGPSLLRLASPVGRNHRTRERTLTQLCLTDDVLARALGPALVSELVLTGSDPYLKTGSDITLLFRTRSKTAFAAAVDAPFQRAHADHPDGSYEHLKYRGIEIERLCDAQRTVSCYRCWLDDVCVYGNSLAGVQRVIDAHQGERQNMASDPGFQYMRAVVFPADADGEDGFVYLSDPFIRNVVGPELRIKGKRRLEALTSLKMLTNAVMYHGYQRGPGAVNLDDLIASGSLNLDDIFDPEGGKITWNSERSMAESDIWGDLPFLTPLIEIHAQFATPEEKQEYDEFCERYSRYWREFFDPIGIRIRADRTIRLETCILPLIDSSAYDRFEDTAGGDPLRIDPDRFTPATLLRFVIKLDEGVLKSQALTFLGALTNGATDWVGQWFTFWIEDTDAFTQVVKAAYRLRDETDRESLHERERRQVLNVFDATFVLGVHNTNSVSLAACLVAIRAMIETTAPNMVVFNNLEPYEGITIVQIAPDPYGEITRRLQLSPNNEPAEPTTRPAEEGPAVYYAAIGDGFYASTQAAALRRLIDRLQEATEPARHAAMAGESEAVDANILLFVAPRAAERIRPAVSYVLEQRAREVSLGNLAQVWMLGRCGVLEGRTLQQAARRFLGYDLVSPHGGVYSFDARTVQAESSFYGPLRTPRRLEALPDVSPLRRLLDSLSTVTASLRFTPDGVATAVTIQRQ